MTPFDYANPHRFLRLAARLSTPLWILTLAALAVGLFMAFTAPEDYRHGATVRIMFVHVPSAWMALFAYSFIFVATLSALVFRHALGHVAARAAAPVGAVFTLATLLTGALWGRPMWGAWWVWDARLTSVLVLFFIYLGYMALWRAIEDERAAARAAALLVLVGAVNLPIVKFSVDWWHTLHQPASISLLSGSALDEAFLYPLFVMGAAFAALFAALTLTRMQSAIMERHARLRQMREA